MKKLSASALALAVIAGLFAAAQSNGQPATSPSSTTRPASTQPAGDRVPLVFSGGHETDRRDGGRPVVLVAAGLGVPDQVFRDAFSHVHPARDGPPTPEQTRGNKAALLGALAKYGVTNDRLDEVSNRYRYRPGSGDLWQHRPAAGFATVNSGLITGVTITDAGAGYSSAPTVTVETAGDQRPPQPLVASLAYGKDLETNGSIKAITIDGPTDGPTTRS